MGITTRRGGDDGDTSTPQAARWAGACPVRGRAGEGAARPRRRTLRLRRSQFLWVDTDELTAELAERLASTLRVDERRAHEMLDHGVRGFRDGYDFVRVSMRTPTTESASEVTRLTCVVGDHWALTAHDQPVAVLDDLAELAAGSGSTGQLTGRRFSPCCSSGC